MSTLQELEKDVKEVADPKRAEISQKFFKTGKGEYGEGDVFIGITVPKQKVIAKKYVALSLKEVQELLNNKVHEKRLIALFILVFQFQKAKGDYNKQKQIVEFYLKNTKKVNNWDLVDSSAHYIVGTYLQDKKDRTILYTLARSHNLWEKRIAIIATFAFIKNKDFKETIKLSEILLQDTHDLMHKAVGWMLREIGKQDEKSLETFLQKHYKVMPRTMLRYAIERIPEKRRKAYLKGEI